MASRGSPISRYRQPAATSIKNIGSQATSSTVPITPRLRCEGRSFGPSRASLPLASSSLRPENLPMPSAPEVPPAETISLSSVLRRCVLCR